MDGWSTNYSANKQMEEFIGNKKKVLKIENPISLFTNLFSIGAENVNKLEMCTGSPYQ